MILVNLSVCVYVLICFLNKEHKLNDIQWKLSHLYESQKVRGKVMAGWFPSVVMGANLFCASPCFLRVCPACLAFFNLKLRHPILCLHLHKAFFPCLSVSKFPLFLRKNITCNGLRVHPTSP